MVSYLESSSANGILVSGAGADGWEGVMGMKFNCAGPNCKLGLGESKGSGVV